MSTSPNPSQSSRTKGRAPSSHANLTNEQNELDESEESKDLNHLNYSNPRNRRRTNAINRPTEMTPTQLLEQIQLHLDEIAQMLKLKSFTSTGVELLHDSMERFQMLLHYTQQGLLSHIQTQQLINQFSQFKLEVQMAFEKELFHPEILSETDFVAVFSELSHQIMMLQHPNQAHGIEYKDRTMEHPNRSSRRKRGRTPSERGSENTEQTDLDIDTLSRQFGRTSLGSELVRQQGIQRQQAHSYQLLLQINELKPLIRRNPENTALWQQFDRLYEELFPAERRGTFGWESGLEVSKDQLDRFKRQYQRYLIFY
ncbi:MAG: hypothetical protein Sylvanvirus1_56 [Sylvanvirus sp.]|uniref:Uncharacterized protein n=1 Tax=Sylvanvirus sp. TaxID=2487774 RepID=A0A3G5AH43_9VIRU|nr:MAG: hypothetical protein Sylvanvirus1_56 [Sylvanvirus sp.]